MRHEFYRFETKQFTILALVEGEDMAPDFDDDDETNAAIADGRLPWFCVTIRVLKNGKVIGSDHLGGCCYTTVGEFFSGHRDPNPMNRNCSIMRTARGGEGYVIGHYFPDMVRQAIRDARNTLA